LSTIPTGKMAIPAEVVLSQSEDWRTFTLVRRGAHAYQVTSGNGLLVSIDKLIQGKRKKYWLPVWNYAAGRLPGRTLKSIAAAVVEAKDVRLGEARDRSLVEGIEERRKRQQLPAFPPLPPLKKRAGRPRSPPKSRLPLSDETKLFLVELNAERNMRRAMARACKACAFCGGPLMARRSTKRWCSAPCRPRVYRKDRRRSLRI
jgi:hypothetical protein